jgi:predicted transglutaminase-like cysteine proteinase
MTDLSLLYGGDDNLLGDNMDNSYSPQKFNKMSNNDMLMEDKHSKSHNSMQQSQQAQQAQQQALQQAQQAQQAQMAQQQAQQAQMAQQQAQQAQQAQQVQYKIENIQNTNTSLVPMNNNQSYKQQPEYDYSKKRGNEYNFFDRMNLKRTEVIKLSLFSLVIVLGISIDRMLTYYLSKYIGDNILTDFQELLLRISYPITIFLLLWIFKAI